MNIYEKINEIRKKIDYIQKDKSVSTGGGSYKAVTHDQVTALVRQHFIDVGVVSYPVLVSSAMNPPLEGAKQSRYEATYDFIFVDVEKPDDKFTIRIEAHAMDNGDKATGKALSYAKKYAILKLLEIETGEDEESRYQDKSLSDTRINEIIESIKEQETPEGKKSLYKAAMNECRLANDVGASNRIKEALK
jgi:hypothetical protein